MASASIATARQTGLAIGIAFSSGIFGSRLAHYNQSSIQNTQVENINPDLVLLAANDTIMLSAIVCALTLFVIVSEYKQFTFIIVPLRSTQFFTIDIMGYKFITINNDVRIGKFNKFRWQSYYPFYI